MLGFTSVVQYHPLHVLVLRLPVRKTCYTICLLRAFARKKGKNNVTVDDLVQVITPKGRGGFISFFFFFPEIYVSEMYVLMSSFLKFLCSHF